METTTIALESPDRYFEARLAEFGLDKNGRNASGDPVGQPLINVWNTMVAAYTLYKLDPPIVADQDRFNLPTLLANAYNALKALEVTDEKIAALKLDDEKINDLMLDDVSAITAAAKATVSNFKQQQPQSHEPQPQPKTQVQTLTQTRTSTTPYRQ